MPQRFVQNRWLQPSRPREPPLPPGSAERSEAATAREAANAEIVPADLPTGPLQHQPVSARPGVRRLGPAAALERLGEVLRYRPAKSRDLELSARSTAGGHHGLMKQRAGLGLKCGQKRAQNFDARRSQLLRLAGAQQGRQLVDSALQDGYH